MGIRQKNEGKKGTGKKGMRGTSRECGAQAETERSGHKGTTGSRGLKKKQDQKEAEKKREEMRRETEKGEKKKKGEEEKKKAETTKTKGEERNPCSDSEAPPGIPPRVVGDL